MANLQIFNASGEEVIECYFQIPNQVTKHATVIICSIAKEEECLFYKTFYAVHCS